MIAPTHAIYGPALALIILAIFGVEASFHWTVISCAMLGALAPDLDHPTSTIGRLFPWISKPLERHFGHRTVTHSALGTVVAAIVFALLLGVTITVLQWFLTRTISISMIPISLSFLHLEFSDMARLTAAFTIAYFSHILLDMLTPRGVQLLWPSPNRDLLFKNSLQIETASKGEVPVAIAGIVLLALAFPLSQQGPMTALRWFLATPESAIAEYKTAHTATFVEFEGTWTATKQPIKGIAEILDVHNKRLVIALDSPEAPSSALPIPANRSRDGLHLRASHTAERHSPLQPMASGSRSTPLDSPPTRTRVIVTLSDELSADISARKVRLIKKETPVKIDKYSFKNQTREQLMKRLPEDAIISGVVYLPKGLKVSINGAIQNSDSALNSGSEANSSKSQGISQVDDTPQSDRNWTSAEQVGNELRLHFATKSELQSLELDKSFFNAQKHDKIKLKRLELRRKEFISKILKLEHPNDGLTDIGRKRLSTPEKEAEKREKIEQLNQQIEAIDPEIEEIQQELDQKTLTFSGWVRVRIKS